MSDKWDFYFSNVNDVLASIFVDLGIYQSAPIESKPYLLWVWVYFNHPRKDGLSSSEEAPVLLEIEDSLTALLQKGPGVQLVGRITSAGRREFYFYAPDDSGFSHAVASSMSRFREY